MKNKVLNKVLLIGGLIGLLGITVAATNLGNYYEQDVTPPWGRIAVKSALKINGINYVESEKVTVEIFAEDDICKEEEIKYYLSLSPIEDVGKIAEENWKSYKAEATEEITIDNLDTINTIYAVFKDKNGNTSHIYSGSLYEQTIVYDMNTTDPVEFDTTVINNKRIHGVPYIIPTQAPKREGYYFIGWSTDQLATKGDFYAEDIIPADMELGTDETTATLYAVWSTDVTKLPLLSDVVEVGDYVDYPVVYDNVISFTRKTGEIYVSNLEGWRVIGKEEDGTVNLISAGIPLTFYNYTNSKVSIPALTDNFITTSFGVGDEPATFRKNGFGPYLTLKEVFTNKYTQMKEDSETPKVQSVVQEDIFKATGLTEIVLGLEELKNKKYERLFETGGYYWLASASSINANRLWDCGIDGGIWYDDGAEFGVRPVVSLKPEVRANGKNMIGVWSIEI